MVKIGMMIGERYEVLEKIGTGGMSDVYKAKDHKLNRFVAVKVLKQEFSENENFVSKFRVEAQAAAGLMHPNIVNVYDVGEEEGIYYIVMELVEGITLKKYIEKKARLSYKEAVSIGIQVSMGIEAAHNNHIIHRDIKPQNIIISRDGKVKVTDFGIAKAATSNTITSNVMGSVHYTSPEQARGGYSDEKSDVYSLGITMFEMLTGRVPFNGETTVAIAIKHIQEELVSPREYVSEIPVSVEAIVMKCCQKSPDRRYQSMGEVIHDLKQSLINPDENIVSPSDVEAQGGTRTISDSDLEQIKRKSIQREDYEEQLRLNTPPHHRHEDEEEYDPEEDEEDYDPEDEEDDSDSRMEKITTVLAIAAGIVICAIILVLVGKISGVFDFGIGSHITDSSQVTPEPQKTPEAEEEKELITMPSISGKTGEEVKVQLMLLGFEVELNYVESNDYEEGVVINSDIAVGTTVPKGSRVVLTVSSGKDTVPVPDVKGRTYEEAYNLLAAEGFRILRAEEATAEVERGRVIRQDIAPNQMAPKGTTVTVTVSIGLEESKVEMPNLVGRDEMTATAMLLERGLTISSVSRMNSDEVEADQVCYQSYSPGTILERGTGVEITISKGKEVFTYKCNAVIEAPTASEAPDYVSGTPVRITLQADDGKMLLDNTTASFPLTANYYGITASAGTISLTYKVTNSVTDEAGNVVSEETQEKTFTRRIDFTRE